MHIRGGSIQKYIFLKESAQYAKIKLKHHGEVYRLILRLQCFL